VIRIRVPLDLHAVATDGATAFALATPLRVRELLAMAVREAIGALAPHDKFLRSVRRTMTGFERGDFSVTVDGREVRDPDDVLVCEGCADVRFFLNIPHAGLQHSNHPTES
jgi:hypothetical protein